MLLFIFGTMGGTVIPMPLNVKSRNLVIVLPTMNRLSGLQKCIQSIRTTTIHDYEIVVADGGSTDGSLEWAREQPDITLVEQGEKLGWIKAVNQVIRELDCKYLTVMADDAEVLPGSFKIAADILDERPDVGLVTLKMKDTIGGGTKKDYMGVVTKFGIHTANHFFMPLSVLKAVGFLHEGYYQYFSDTDLTAAVLSAGWTTVLTKQVCILHHRAYGNDKAEVDRRWKNEKAFVEVYSKRYAYLGKHGPKAIRRYEIIASFGPIFGSRWGMSRTDWDHLGQRRWTAVYDPLLHLGKTYYFEQKIPLEVRQRRGNPYSGVRELWDRANQR